VSGENSDSLIAKIAADPWHGRGRDLLSLLAHRDGGVRSAAAVRVGQLLSDSEVGLPDRRAVFDFVQRRDAEQPGVADAFLTTIIYDYRTDDEHGDLKQWLLAVLEARQHHPPPLSSVPGNDLEFYAHELLDSDFDWLTRLLAAGYTGIVENALGHRGTLPRAQVVALRRALFERTKHRFHAECLAIEYGLLLDEVRRSWPRVLVGGVPATVLSMSYGYRRSWTVHWLFFESAMPQLSALSDDTLLATLVAAGIELDQSPSKLDAAAVRHIPFPDVDGTTRVERRLRADHLCDLSVNGRGEVTIVRIVRSLALL
jgi:hypothetical protein